MATYAVVPVSTVAEMAALQPEWACLFYAAATPNPFAHPLWMATWARHFISPAQLYILAVRNAAGVLVGVAPFYRRRYTLGPGTLGTAFQLLGTGQHVDLTELSQVLVQPGLERPVLRTIMRHLGERAEEWDWVELVLPPEQGWFEPEWLPQKGPGAGSFVLHKAARPCVVLPLPRSWEDLRAGMKRNVKESLRHGINSLKREGHTWQLAVPGDAAALTSAINQLVTLHRARARMRGKVRHSDHLAGAADRAFLYDVAHHMFSAGHLTPCLLEVDGVTAAARLVLHANRTTFFSCSGFDPTWWRHNVATTLMAECLRRAIEQRQRMANLSPGPDVAKLRWSERLELHQEFLMVGPRRRSRVVFSLYWQLRAAEWIRRESRRHEEA